MKLTDTAPGRASSARTSPTASGRLRPGRGQGRLRPRHARPPAHGHDRRPVPRRRQARPLGRAPEGGRRSTTPRRGTRDGFGGVEGTLRGYLAGRRAMVAARVGGRRVWGDYPWFESAFVGGSKNLRGYRKNRFAGDASLYGSVEARLWLFKGRLIAPGRWGIFGLADTGPRLPRGRLERRLAHVLRRRHLLPDADAQHRVPRRGRARRRRHALLRELWLCASDAARHWRALARISLLGGLVALAAVPRASAQDTHYWSIQYGPVGQLVGGQLIGGASDLSATFYNPGALALRNESSYLLSTESVQWEIALDRAAAGRLRVRHLVVALRLGAVALGRSPAALARRGHAPRLVVPDPPEPRRRGWGSGSSTPWPAPR